VKRIAILGCNGSIGQQTLQVVDWHPDEFQVVALASRHDTPDFRNAVGRHRPKLVGVSGGTEGGWLPDGSSLLRGDDCLTEIARDERVDLVVVATSGRAGLAPTLAALESGKNVALANKEALVTAGSLVMRAAAASGAAVLPVDSEHSGLWQCLLGEPTPAPIRRAMLTASGGALRDVSLDQLKDVTPEQALQHPNWSMGAKITIDSATLMNKGLEVLEAACLFGLSVDQIEVLVHRESIVHALVEFEDHSVKAQLAVPDMRLPILYALSFPRRLLAPASPLDLARIGRLSFAAVDHDRYPCLLLAYQAGRLGATYPAVLNASNEEAVNLFLSGSIGYLDICPLVDTALQAHVPIHDADLAQFLSADCWARSFTLQGALEGPSRGRISARAV
jgi:1-deoxy-D-xylulose-5-phosphate reductoisomerase